MNVWWMFDEWLMNGKSMVDTQENNQKRYSINGQWPMHITVYTQ